MPHIAMPRTGCRGRRAATVSFMHRRTAALLQCLHVVVLAVLVLAVAVTVIAVPSGAPRSLAPLLMGVYIVVMCAVGVSSVVVMHRRSIRRGDRGRQRLISARGPAPMP